MISWGTKRRLSYILIIIFVIVLVIAIFGFLTFYKSPTCADGKQNGDELGIDCGGNCPKICRGTSEDLRINWTRVFKVKDGFYSVGAYVENPNKDSEAKNVSYKFKIYDSENILVSEFRGMTFVPKGQSFGIFQGGISINNREPVRAELSFDEEPLWYKSYDVTNDFIVIKDVSKSFDVGESPRVSVLIENQGLRTASNIIAFAAIYGNNGNVIAASETNIDKILGGEKKEIVFSWPIQFGESVGRVEILHWIAP